MSSSVKNISTVSHYRRQNSALNRNRAALLIFTQRHITASSRSSSYSAGLDVFASTDRDISPVHLLLVPSVVLLYTGPWCVRWAQPSNTTRCQHCLTSWLVKQLQTNNIPAPYRQDNPNPRKTRKIQHT